MSSSLTTSLLTSTSRKRFATTDTLAEPLENAFSMEITDVLTGVRGMLSISEKSTITVIDTKKDKRVYISFKGAKRCTPMMHIGQMLDP